MKANVVRYLAVAAMFFSSSLNLYAQASANSSIKDFIQKSSLKAYDNPQRAIRLGDSIFQNSTEKDIQIHSLLLSAHGYSALRNYPKSLDYISKAQDLSHQLEDEKLQIILINKIAIFYHELGVFDKAIQLLDESEELSFKYPIIDSVYVQLGTNYVVRGFVYKDQLSPTIAIEYFQKGVEFYEKANNQITKPNLSVVYYNIGNSYILLENYDLAIVNFKKSLDIAKSINANSLEAFALKGLAEVYSKTEQPQKALESLQLAESKSLHVGDLVLNKGIYAGFMDVYLKLNQWDQFQKYEALFESVQDSIKQVERKSITNFIQSSTDEEVEKQQVVQKRFLLSGILLILTSILLVVVFLYKNKKNKIRVRELREKLNSQITDSTHS